MRTRAPAKRSGLSESRKDETREQDAAQTLETILEAIGDLARRITALEAPGSRAGGAADAIRFENLERHLEEIEERLTALEEEKGL